MMLLMCEVFWLPFSTEKRKLRFATNLLAEISESTINFEDPK